MSCPECEEPLTAITDVSIYQRTGVYEYQIICPDCGFERQATDSTTDQEIIDRASERYWLRRQL